jgi:hypothetical protein
MAPLLRGNGKLASILQEFLQRCRQQLCDRYCVIGFFVFLAMIFDVARQIDINLQLKKVFDAPMTTITLDLYVFLFVVMVKSRLPFNF